MPGHSPYRGARGAAGTPVRGVFFLPERRIYLAPLAVVVALVAMRIGPAAPIVLTGRMECSDRVALSVHKGRQERFDDPILPCWCRAPPELTVNDVSPYRTFACEEATSRLVALEAAIPPGATMTVLAGRAQEEISLAEAIERFAGCSSQAPRGSCDGLVEVRVATAPTRFGRDVLGLVLALLLLLATLPTRLVRVHVDAANGVVRARDASLFRRAYVAERQLEEVVDVVDHPEGLALLHRDGTYTRLSDPDGRPGALKERTLADLRALVADARASEPGAIP